MKRVVMAAALAAAGCLVGMAAVSAHDMASCPHRMKDAHAAGPKMAALLAGAAEPAPEVPFLSLSSEGVILIYGRDEQAIEAARLLEPHLDVTVLLTRPDAVAPARVTEFPVVKGTVRTAKGHLGAFELTVDDYAAAAPSSRGAIAFPQPRVRRRQLWPRRVQRSE